METNHRKNVRQFIARGLSRGTRWGVAPRTSVGTATRPTTKKPIFRDEQKEGARSLTELIMRAQGQIPTRDAGAIAKNIPGYIKDIHPRNQFGFIVIPGGIIPGTKTGVRQTIFFHLTDCVYPSEQAPEIKDMVTLDIVPDAPKYRAVNIRLGLPAGIRDNGCE